MSLDNLVLRVKKEKLLPFRKFWLEDPLVIRENEENMEDLDPLVLQVSADLLVNPVYLVSLA